MLNTIETQMHGVMLFTPQVHQDERGVFYEQWHQQHYAQHLPCDFAIKQSNVSTSKQYVLRGLHLQVNKPQAKLIEVLSGQIFDVVLDLRKNSPTFGKTQHFILDAAAHQQLFVPKGFAHGFMALSPETSILYHCDEWYYPEHERCICWDDKQLNINWPNHAPILSTKDNSGMTLQEYIECEY